MSLMFSNLTACNSSSFTALNSSTAFQGQTAQLLLSEENVPGLRVENNFHVYKQISFLRTCKYGNVLLWIIVNHMLSERKLLQHDSDIFCVITGVIWVGSEMSGEKHERERERNEGKRDERSSVDCSGDQRKLERTKLWTIIPETFKPRHCSKIYSAFFNF